MSPSFNYNVVIGYLPTFNKNGHLLIDELTKRIGGPAFDIRHVIVTATLNSFMEATLGSEMVDEDKEKFKTYMAA